MKNGFKRLLATVLFFAIVLSLSVGLALSGSAATYPIDIGYAASSGGACDGWIYELGLGSYVTSSNVSSSYTKYRINLVTAFGDSSALASKTAYFEKFNQNVEGYTTGTMRPLAAPAYIYLQGYNYGTSSLVYSHNQANTTIINGKNYSDSAPYTGTGSSVGTIYKSATTDDLVALSSGNLTFINILLDHRATSGNLDAVFQTGGTLTFSNSTAQVATLGAGLHVQGTGVIDKIENSTVKNTNTAAATANNKNFKSRNGQHHYELRVQFRYGLRYLDKRNNRHNRRKHHRYFDRQRCCLGRKQRRYQHDKRRYVHGRYRR